MSYGKRPYFSSYVMPALYASTMTSVIAAYAFSADLYIGAVYAPNLQTMVAVVEIILVLGIPAALFALFAVWPLALFSAELTAWILRRAKSSRDWTIWLLTGAVLGGPALFFYSFPLRFGQTMLGPLLLNGAILGMICAALVRKFAGPQIDDAATRLEDEGARDPS